MILASPCWSWYAKTSRITSPTDKETSVRDQILDTDNSSDSSADEDIGIVHAKHNRRSRRTAHLTAARREKEPHGECGRATPNSAIAQGASIAPSDMQHCNGRSGGHPLRRRRRKALQ